MIILIIFRPKRKLKKPLDERSLKNLTKKTFSGETLKKVSWVKNMFVNWMEFRNTSHDLQDVVRDLDDVSSFDQTIFNEELCKFITEVKKLDGSEFPAKTLYDIVICLQFHLETLGLMWKLLSDDIFKDVRFMLDNLMKSRTQEGIGNKVRRAQVLTFTDEDLLWSLGLLGTHSPEALLYSVLYTIGLSCSLRAGKEHYQLRSIPFQSQFTFLTDGRGRTYFKFVEDVGLKTNKGGLKHRKFEPKMVDVYPISNIERCPVRLLQKYLHMLPKNCNCKRLYLQPKKKYCANCWYLDAPVGENKLRSFVKHLTTKAGIPGFFTNHSLRASSCTRMYQSGVEEQVIQEVSGHRSLAVRSYKHTSDRQREIASNSIFGDIGSM